MSVQHLAFRQCSLESADAGRRNVDSREVYAAKLYNPQRRSIPAPVTPGYTIVM